MTVVTSQICDFGNWIPEKLTGCLRDLEEVSGLTTTFGLSQAYFEGGKGVGFVGFYDCGCFLTSLIFHWEATEQEQAACPCLSCSPEHWGHLTWALPPPLHIAVGKEGHTKMPHMGHSSASQAG